MRISEKKGVRQITMGITNKHDFQGTVEKCAQRKKQKEQPLHDATHTEAKGGAR